MQAGEGNVSLIVAEIIPMADGPGATARGLAQ